MTQTETQKLMQWYKGKDAGLSSKYIAAVMTGSKTGRKYYPFDPADLGRCLRLLELFPEWAGRINEMSTTSEEWKSLAGNWGKLSDSMQREVGIHWEKGSSAPLTYQLMRDILNDTK